MLNHSKTSLGNYLKQRREEKGLSIDEAAIETNIAKKYIEALENDEYGFFPAEMYVVGFLSAYVEVLELDKEQVLSMYQRSLTKEQEAPLEEVFSLYNNEAKIKKHTTLLMILLPIIFILTLFGLFSFNKSNSTKIYDNETMLTENNSDEISIDISSLNQNNEFQADVYDTILLVKNGSVISSIKFLGYTIPDKEIKFQLGQNIYTKKRGDILNADLYTDGNNNLNVEIIDVANNKVRFVLSVKDTSNVVTGTKTFNIATYSKSIRTEIPIASIANVQQLTMKITASGYVWVEYQTDTQKPAQILLKNGEVVEFKFSEYVFVSLGNAGLANISFNEIPNTIKGGIVGETSYSIFYKKISGSDVKLYRALLK